MTPAGIDGRVNVALIPSVEERNLSRATLEAVRHLRERCGSGGAGDYTAEREAQHPGSVHRRRY